MVLEANFDFEAYIEIHKNTVLIHWQVKGMLKMYVAKWSMEHASSFEAIAQHVNTNTEIDGKNLKRH